MKKMFRKMVSMVSAMVIAASCSVGVIRSMSMNKIEANAMAIDPVYTEHIEAMAVKFNEARVELGLDPLYIVPYINDIAQIRADEQPVNYSHYRPDGTYFVSVIDVDVVDYQIAGEILARGTDDVDAIFEAWKNSPVHWANITKPGATHVGIGLTYDAANNNYYWAAIFVGMWEDSDTLPGQRMPGKNEPDINNPGVMILDDDNPIAVEDDYVPGDVTMDGIVTVSDATLVLIAYTNESSGKECDLTEAQKIAADIDGDGNITGADATTILRMATELSA